MKCNHCGNDIPAKQTDTEYRKRWNARADRAMKQLDETGLDDWLQQRGLSKSKFAQTLDISPGAITNWQTRGNIPKESRALIRSAVFAGQI